MQHTATGTFQLRATSRAEVRAPVAGFLREVKGDEGDRLASGATLARLDIPDLDSRIAQKKADMVESDAKLRVLRAGPRGGLQGTTPGTEVQIRTAEIDAEKARLAKLEQELTYLQQQRERLVIRVPVAGIISTPRMAEKVGQYFKEGDLICVV